MIRALRTRLRQFLAARRLQRMVAANRSAPCTKAFAGNRAAQKKGRARA